MLTLPRSDTHLDLTFATEPYVPPACEGASHPKQLFDHVLGQTASYACTFPCGRTVLMCAGWVAGRRRQGATGLVKCNQGCDQVHEVRDLHFTPLD
ncbi:hypothetical protein GCM10025773_12160 [Microbacterium jejuense]